MALHLVRQIRHGIAYRRDREGEAIRARRLQPGTLETKHILGKMYLASFSSGVATPGFDAAV